MPPEKSSAADYHPLEFCPVFGESRLGLGTPNQNFCQTCNKAFRHSSDLKAHVLKAHPWKIIHYQNCHEITDFGILCDSTSYVQCVYVSKFLLHRFSVSFIFSNTHALRNKKISKHDFMLKKVFIFGLSKNCYQAIFWCPCAWIARVACHQPLLKCD